ncbi:uncharacterized protein LOC142328395 [Lycorma delicatula]|uniref:uncharacterized protein LOC142328395 n=1 Tax=Lycorma delicatula TaxID=130591 RepID=UPI003F511024
MSNDMAFDWSDKLDSGTNHWQPAYGYQQPLQLQEAFLQQHERNLELINNDSISPQQAYRFYGNDSLETILEETSDDLRSESDYSGPAGWPDTDSETESVIHVVPLGASSYADWGGSERDLAVPKKRRRRQLNNDPGVHEDDDDERDNISSRSSSLLQFETLERHCEDVSSNVSYDSLEAARWRFRSSSQDSLEDEASSMTSSCESSSDVTSSDDEALNRSFSSRSGSSSFRSSSGLRSYRSFDSLNLYHNQEKPETPGSFLSGEFSQSLNNNSIPPEENTEAVPAPRGIYKTVECLTDVTGHGCGRGLKNSQTKLDSERNKNEDKTATKGGQRSSENLSEDSGFGEHIPRDSSGNLTRSSGKVYPIVEDEYNSNSCSSYYSDISREDKGGVEDTQLNITPSLEPEPSVDERSRGWTRSDAEAKFNQSSWQSAPDLLAAAQSKPDLYTVPFVSTSALVVNFVQRTEDELIVIPEDKSILDRDRDQIMTSRLPIVSTPNLYKAADDFLNEERNNLLRNFAESTISLGGESRSLKKKTASEGKLSTTSSRGSNIQITTSFINLTPSNSSKGVHFSPVVSEVSWQDSDGGSEGSSHEEKENEIDHVTEEEHRQQRSEQQSVSVAVQTQTNMDLQPASHQLPPTPPKNKHGRFGGFFQRFSFRRLSGKKGKDKKRPAVAVTALSSPPPRTAPTTADVQIIPLHPPGADKPPLPARRRDSPRRGEEQSPGLSAMSTRHHGLLETDLDSDLTKKTRSLLSLEDGMKPSPAHLPREELARDAETRAKSMEFLLDKENQEAIKPPENELQKVGAGGGERVMSEHQLRVQRSLQRLNVPEWYKNSTLPAQGFLLKRNSDAGSNSLSGWPGLSSKTTSLSSLGSSQSAVPRSPTGGNVLSPSPTPHIFSRWSTSKLNSAATSTSTSPCGSARSSFNYRQPYLGWRSQERLARPRTPAERLAAGILPQKQAQNTPNLNEVRTSIKEVTSAIVHYVSGTTRTAGDSLDRLSPALNRLDRDRDNSSSRSASPRGSTGRLCWLESSFVGSRPLEVPETPVGPPQGSHNRGHDLYLDLTNSTQLQRPQLNGELLLSDGAPAHYYRDVMNHLNNTFSRQWIGLNGQVKWLPQSHASGLFPLWLDEVVSVFYFLSGFMLFDIRSMALFRFTATSISENRNERLSNLLLEPVAVVLTAMQKMQYCILITWNTVVYLESLLLSSSSSSSPSSTSVSPSVVLSESSYMRSVDRSKYIWFIGAGDESPQFIASQQAPTRSRPSPTSTTMDDVLDSLLGLPSTSRSPSPSPGPTTRRSCGDLRSRSDLQGSASNGPPYYTVETARRGSEGNEPKVPMRSGRRVSFDVDGTEEGLVKCRFAKCGKTATVVEAKKTFKTCHNCAHVYCSRDCRRAHWEKHRKTCLHSRVGALCRRVLSTIKEDPDTLHHVSVLARRGFLARGRGAVKCFFSSPELAERFVANGLKELGEPTFVRWADLLPGEMGPELYSELLKLCKAYNPDTRFVLYVAVCVVSEVPTTGAVKWERQLVSRCTKLKLSRPLLAPSRQTTPNITRDSDDPETLILTSLPGCLDQNIQRARQISFTNIQRHLRQRGVSLRRHFPEVYQRLCAYVEGSTERFTPVTIYPRDSATGKSFMCIIMPDAEPEKLQLLPTDSTRVQTIDISQEPQSNS